MVAVHIDQLNVHYGSHQVLKNISFDVEDKDFVCIMGPNGGGKTTLLKSLLGIVPSYSGKIEIFNTDIKKSKERIGYVPQFATMNKRFPVSVLDVVKMGLHQNGLHPFFKYTRQDIEQAMEHLQFVGLENLAKRRINELSGGEFQRMLIARALVGNPKIVLLDEPTASVDPASRENIYELLGEVNQNIAVILVTHDLFAISSSIKTIACLNEHLVYHGEPMLSVDVIEHLYGCPVDLIAHGVPHRVLRTHERDPLI